MSSFPISITWQVAPPPVGGFNQLAQAANSLDQALSKSASQMGQFASGVGQLEGPLQGAAQGMGEMASGMGELEGSIGGAADGMGEMASATGELEGSIGGVADSVGEAAGGMTELADGASESGSAMGELSTSVEDTSTGLADMTTGIEDTSTGLTDMSTAMEETNTGFEDMITNTEDTTTGMGDLSTSTEDTGNAMGILADESSTAASDMSTLDDTITDVGESTDTAETNISDLGGAFGTAADSSDDFTGALSGMNEEFPGVTGGLDDSNTLAGNLSGTTTKLNTNMTGLGIGMAGVSGAAVGLFNAYDNLGDAAVAVEGAHAALIRTQGRALTSVAGLDKMISNLNKKFGDQITGLPALNAAYAEWRALVDKGITSGAAYDKALQNLRTAQSNLTSTTQAGNTAITQLGGKISATEAALIKLVVAQNNEANALEDQNKAWLQSATSIIPSLILGLTGAKDIATTLKGVWAALPAVGLKFAGVATTLATAFSGLGTILTGTVLPALAAIAAPVGIAVGALVAFVAAVTAIRANIKIFDDLGVAIGKVFPTLVPWLQDARQGFINLSDGVNSAISVMLGGLDSLTGGVFDLQQKWNGFTDTLPKGTGEIGLAGNAMGQLAHMIGATGEQINIGAGKWKEMNGTLVAFSGKVKVAAGGWHELRDGTAVYSKELAIVTTEQEKATTAVDAYGATAQGTNIVLKAQSANYSELTNAQKLSVQAMNNVTERLADEREKRGMAVMEAQKYLMVIEGITPAVGLSGAAIVGMAEALSGEADAHFKAVSEAAKYIQQKDATFLTVARTDAEILKYAETLKAEEKASGKATDATAKHVAELEKMKGALADTNAELLYYADSANKANRMQLEFNKGAADAKKAIQDEAFELANLAGELSVWNDEQQRAQALVNAFNKGILEQKKALQDDEKALAEAAGKLQELQEQMQKGTAMVLAFNKGLIDGRTKVLEFQKSLAQSSAETITFEAGLRKLVRAAGVDLKSALSMSADQMELLLGAMAGAPDAVREVISAFDEMGQSIVESLADAAKEGKKEFMTAIDELQKEAGMKFSKPMIQKLTFEANLENATREIQTGLGVLATMLRNKPLAIALQTTAAQDALTQLREKVNLAAIEAPEKFVPLQRALDKLAAWKTSPDMTKLPGILGGILVASQNMEGGMQGAISSFQGMFDAAAQSAEGLEGLKTTLAGIGLTLDTQTGIITDATGQIVGDLQTMAEKAAGSTAGTVVALDTLGPAGTKARTTLAYEMVALTFIMDTFAQETKQSAIEVSTAFANMVTNTSNSLNKMASGFIIIITAMARIASDSQRTASTVSGSFSNMSTNTIASMNRMASGIIIILSSFTRITSEAQKMNSAVSSAMSQMASRTSSFASTFSSAMSRVGSSASSATSKVKALQSSINALKSKTITITTIIRTVRQTVYAARGGSFVTASPTNVGPLNVSEFGQKELVTVTPLETPARNAVKGISNLINQAVEKKGRRAMDEEREEPKGTKGRRKEMVMVREMPIIIQVDGREISRVVNRRIFEESDALT